MQSKLIVNKRDRRRLMKAIETARNSWRTYAPYLDWLAGELGQAHALEPADMPEGVVTMNSRVEIQDVRTGKKEAFTLVYPEGPVAGDAISVFAPTGLALLGSRVGDVLQWSEQDRTRTARVRRLHYQPESAGDLHL